MGKGSLLSGIHRYLTGVSVSIPYGRWDNGISLTNDAHHRTSKEPVKSVMRGFNKRLVWVS